MHPFASIFIFWFVCMASLRGFVSCQGKSAGFQAKAMWRRSGMWFGPCHGAIPRETCALLWRCASENDLFCSFAWHCLCAWMRSSLVLHLTVSAKIAFGMRGRCLKKVARSSNSKQTSNLDALCPWTRRSEWSQCSKPCDGGQTQVNSDKSQRRKKHRNTKQNGTGTRSRKRLYHVAVTSLCFKDSWTCCDPNTKEGLQGVRSAGTLKHRQGEFCSQQGLALQGYFATGFTARVISRKLEFSSWSFLCCSSYIFGAEVGSIIDFDTERGWTSALRLPSSQVQPCNTELWSPAWFWLSCLSAWQKTHLNFVFYATMIYKFKMIYINIF